MDPRLLAYFAEYVTESRKAAIERILQRRTRKLAVVLEDIYQPQNASAVIRTCDCFGIQDVYVIENANKFKVNPKVVHGASKWVNIEQFNRQKDNTEECLNTLRAKGYYLLATTPDPAATPIHEFTLDKPAAILFGTELTGLSETAFSMVDHKVTIPMYGFSESLNLSVSVSLILSILRQKLEATGNDWHLQQDEMDEIRLKWYKHSVSRSDILENEFMKNLRE